MASAFATLGSIRSIRYAASRGVSNFSEQPTPLSVFVRKACDTPTADMVQIRSESCPNSCPPAASPMAAAYRFFIDLKARQL